LWDKAGLAGGDRTLASKITHPDAEFADFKGAEDAEGDALLALLTTKPTSVAGVAALLQYIQTNSDRGEMFFMRYRQDLDAAGDAFFGLLADALRSIAGSPPFPTSTARSATLWNGCKSRPQAVRSYSTPPPCSSSSRY
jgi:hypothetical protein